MDNKTNVLTFIAAKKAEAEKTIAAQKAAIEALAAKEMALEAYQQKLDELKTLAETYQTDFDADIEVDLGIKPTPKKSGKGDSRIRKAPVEIADDTLTAFVEIKSADPDAPVEVLKKVTNLKRQTLKKLDRAYEKSDKTFEGLKTILQMAG